MALDLLTGRTPDDTALEPAEPPAPMPEPVPPPKPHVSPRVRFAPRTVYLSEQDLRDLDFIARVWAKNEKRPLSRSHILRKAIASLRHIVEADDALPGAS
jgi:hypothetical protein